MTLGLALAALACEKEKPPPPPPSPVVLWIDGEPVLGEDVERLAGFLARFHPNAARNTLRTLALGNAAIPRAVALARHRDALPIAQARIERARERLAAGEPFEDVARSLSDQKAEEGGDHGWIGWDELDLPLAERAFTLPLGVPSEPVVTRFGVHLVRAIARREGDHPRDRAVHLFQIVARFDPDPASDAALRPLVANCRIEVAEPAWEDLLPPAFRSRVVRREGSPSPGG